ncbi:hypothetical protein HZC21_04315 [Candidatus Peregrinibacteria bacterium]|nr:hypothetical protein [Candidatus Peregrinibacteria bacterium]
MLLQKLKEKIQYPKFFVLLISIITAYILFQTHFFLEFAKLLNSHGYISIFLAGLLFSYGFTAPFAVGFFIELASEVNIFIAAPLAGIGALVSDLIIFKFIRVTFQDEFDKLKLTWIFQKIHRMFDDHLSDRFKKYALWTFAGFLIASPFPDEFGVSLISGFTNINRRVFSLISYILNTTGIFIIFLLA